MSENATVRRIVQLMQEIVDLQSVHSLLSWDQETMMPVAASPARAEQISTLDAILHRIFTSAETLHLLDDAKRLIEQEHNLSENDRRLITLFIKDVEKRSKLPEKHIRRLSYLTSYGQVVWRKARSEADFSIFAPVLHELVDLQRQTAEYYGYDEHPYDALLDEYEPGMKLSLLQPLFYQLKEFLLSTLQQVLPYAAQDDDTWLSVSITEQQQVEFAIDVIQKIGFDLSRGRVDLSTHPFCTSFSPNDVRLTTRVDPHDFRTCFFSLLHEAGHGLYEQGIVHSYPRTFAASGASVGIHESQSLFWEDIIGRSLDFWIWNIENFKKYFPNTGIEITPEMVFRAVNRVKPSLIRIDADELTYHLHIILRMELEIDLFEGKLPVSQIPEAWNSKMEEYLGVLPPNDAFGCLQDIHWSFGGFGYFPTYTLGKLYAAMFWTQINRDIQNVSALIRNGEFAPILQWLRNNIHKYGRLLQPAEILQHCCQRELTIDDFQSYLSSKLALIYNSTNS